MFWGKVGAEVLGTRGSCPPLPARSALWARPKTLQRAWALIHPSAQGHGTVSHCAPVSPAPASGTGTFPSVSQTRPARVCPRSPVPSPAPRPPSPAGCPGAWLVCGALLVPEPQPCHRRLWESVCKLGHLAGAPRLVGQRWEEPVTSNNLRHAPLRTQPLASFLMCL